MKLNIIGNPEDTIPENEVDKNAMGGTELMKYALYDKLPKSVLEQFQIIPSRFRGLEKDKKSLAIRLVMQICEPSVMLRVSLH